jgi:hypothetical protein
MSELLKINVNGHVEKKGQLSYLSWAWAWAEVLKIDPLATWAPDLTNGAPCVFLPDGSALVSVSVTIKGHAKGCILPVMNHQNKAIKNPDAFAINTAIMRCLAKAIAMHGLGLYIYAGEDLPEGEDKPEGEPDIRCKPAEECFKMLQPEIQAFLRRAAPRIEAAMPDVAEVRNRIGIILDNYPEDDQNDVRAGLEHLLDSKVRSAIKRAEKETA